jgi:hypothetical protein
MTTKALLLCLIMASCLISSCTTDTDELRSDLKKQNERYIGRQERWRMRKEARQERTDAWFKRMMN